MSLNFQCTPKEMVENLKYIRTDTKSKGRKKKTVDHFFKLKVDLGNGVQKSLAVSNKDNPNTLASIFSNKYKLNKAQEAELASLIERNIKNIMSAPKTLKETQVKKNIPFDKFVSAHKNRSLWPRTRRDSLLTEEFVHSFVNSSFNKRQQNILKEVNDRIGRNNCPSISDHSKQIMNAKEKIPVHMRLYKNLSPKNLSSKHCTSTSTFSYPRVKSMQRKKIKRSCDESSKRQLLKYNSSVDVLKQTLNIEPSSHNHKEKQKKSIDSNIKSKSLNITEIKPDFRPTIGREPKFNRNESKLPIGDYLHAQKKQDKVVEKEEANESIMNEESKRLIGKMKANSYQKLFMDINPNNNETISSNNIDLTCTSYYNNSNTI